MTKPQLIEFLSCLGSAGTLGWARMRFAGIAECPNNQPQCPMPDAQYPAPTTDHRPPTTLNTQRLELTPAQIGKDEAGQRIVLY